MRRTASVLSALDSLPDAILVLDAQNRVSYCNSAFVTLYGEAAAHLELWASSFLALPASKRRYGELPESTKILRDGER